MKLISLSLSVFLSTLPASLALVGCAGETADGEEVATAQGELSGIEKALVGSYQWNAGLSGEFVDFYTLNLKSDGTYTAEVEATLVNPGVRCVQAPCTLPESGTWSVYKVAGGAAFRVRPTEGTARVSTLEQNEEGVTLTRLERTSTLVKKSTPRSACAAVMCAPNTMCVELAGKASCAKIGTAACAAILCGPSSTCVEIDGKGSCLAK